MKPIGKVIKNIISNLEVKCPNQDCGKIMRFEEHEKHETICDLPKCQNEKCKRGREQLILYKHEDGKEYRFCCEMCKYSFIFQQKTKNLNKDELCDWFHQFVTITLKDDLHKECERKITNLKNMVRAVSGNNSMKINDIDYDPGISVFK